MSARRDRLTKLLKVIATYQGAELHTHVLELLREIDGVYADEWASVPDAAFAVRKGAGRQIKELLAVLEQGRANPPLISG